MKVFKFELNQKTISTLLIEGETQEEALAKLKAALKTYTLQNLINALDITRDYYGISEIKQNEKPGEIKFKYLNTREIHYDI